MDLPPGCNLARDKENQVCKLRKSLYGLKQSPRAWFGRFTKYMKNFGYIQSNGKHTLFLKRDGRRLTALIVYVDGIVVIENDTKEQLKLHKYLSQEFEMEDLGDLKYFLGIEVAKSTTGIFRSQRQYVLDLFIETGMLGCKPADIPIEMNHKLCEDMDQEPTNKELYQRLVGMLIYLAHTRPDIAYVVSVVSQFMHSLSVSHRNAIDWILRYLKSALGKDVDWAGSIIDRRSTSGYFTFVGGMESEGNSQNFEQGKKGTRRSWSKFEEDSFLTVLDDFVAAGQRCETGSFKSGTMVQMEKALNIKCPDSGLKACPHIESKLKKWKKQYSIVYDMINTSGFAWNDIKKCVEVDSNDAWETYVQHHKEAAEWRSKPFPLFDRLSNIFGKDRANGQRAEAPADMMEEQSNNDVNASDNCVQEDASPMSLNIEGSQSMNSQNKRKRATSSSDEEKIVTVLEKLFEASGKRMQMVTEAIIKGNEDRSDIAKELKRMGFSPLDQITALKLILEKPQNISIFMSLDDDIKKVFVEQLLSDNA
ncbi:uncharacterized protein LOC117626648 [Prunus dulcis]|nr:uncharacterized protein LOC117626648 [Prunus dulcis]